MVLMEDLRRLFGRAKEQATDMAQVARIKLDIRNLEGRRDSIFRDIGRKAFAMEGEGRGIPEFASMCADVRGVEQEIAKKQEELRSVRTRPAAQGSTAGESPGA